MSNIQQPPQIKLVLAVGQGPSGPQGPIGPSGGSALVKVAGAAIGGHRIVYSDVNEEMQYADCLIASHALTIMGLTLGSAIAGANLSILRSGEVVEPSWNWDITLPVYLGSNGLLTQVLPNNAEFCMIVGAVLSPTTLFVSLNRPIFLN